MERFVYESEVLKNYFIRNGSFSALSDRESRLYNNLAQAKFKNFGGNPLIDVDAPGGMQTLLYRVMGLKPIEKEGKPQNKVEAYAVYLAMLVSNGVELTRREQNHLDKFLDYYSYDSVQDMAKDLDLPQLPYYTLADTILTAGIYSLLEGSKEEQFKEFVNTLEFKDIMDLLTTKYQECVDYLAKLLPEITYVPSGGDVLIKEDMITVPETMNIMWQDLIIMCTLGLKYRGLYHPQLQLGVYLRYKFQGNLLFLDPELILIDDIYRRRYGLKNLLEFWGVSEPFPVVSMTKGYVLFPFFAKGENLTGSDKRVEELYYLWTPEQHSMVLDEWMLGIVYPHLPNLVFTDDYRSKYVASGYVIPCLVKDGVTTPLPEALVDSVPANGDFSILTAYNLGLR